MEGKLHSLTFLCKFTILKYLDAMVRLLPRSEEFLYANSIPDAQIFLGQLAALQHLTDDRLSIDL